MSSLFCIFSLSKIKNFCSVKRIEEFPASIYENDPLRDFNGSCFHLFALKRKNFVFILEYSAQVDFPMQFSDFP